jgi:hypothetical protein
MGRAQLLQVLYTVRSERQLMEQLDYNLLFRWFVGLNMAAAGRGDRHGIPGAGGRPGEPQEFQAEGHRARVAG